MRIRPVVLFVSLALAVVGAPGDLVAQSAKRPIEMPDILEWKSAGARALAADGSWFAYVLSPTEGDSEVVVRAVGDSTEYRFGVGEMPPFGGGRLEFSRDGQWLAFEIRPDAAAAGRAQGPANRPTNSAGLVELATGELKKFEQVGSFAFGGDGETWVAIHKQAPSGRDNKDWRGSDLLLRRATDGTTLTIGNVASYAFNDSGEWLATIVDTDGATGNGVQLRQMRTGRVLPMDSADAVYDRLNWTEEGDAFTVLRGSEDDDYEDRLYMAIGFRDLAADSPSRVEYDPAADADFPEGMTINANHDAAWSDDRDALVFRIHEAEKKQDAAADDDASTEGETDEPAPPARMGRGGNDEPDTADLVIWHWRDRRLQSRQQVQERQDRNFGYLATYRIAEERFVRLADDDVRNVNPAPGQRWAIGLDNDAYEREGNLNGERLSDVWIVDMRTGERRMALEGMRYVYGPSPAGTHLLYYDDGNFYTLDLASGASVNLTGDLGVPFWNVEDDHNVVKPPVFQFGLGWSDAGDELLLQDGWDIWKVAADGSEAVNLTVSGRANEIRYQRAFRLDPDLDGIDLTAPVYVTSYGEWTKKGGIAQIDPERPGVNDLLWDDAVFGSLVKAEDADVYLYTRETSADPPNFYAAAADLGAGRQVSDTNPQQAELAWSSGVRLVDYTSAKGVKLQGALFLPADYEPGRQYPTMVYIYEKLSQGANRFYTPTANGFNKSVYTSAGYAVLMPDIVYEVNDPGQSAVWSVLPALDAAIATGVVDPDAVGLHGHSWGGYQTAHLITQTNRFTAAIAGAPLTNMISMYSLIYKNSGGGNGAIFEASQGRFTGGPWEVPDAYVRNSPVYHAANVTTPLVILHNDQDGAVDFTQGVEYYNTLRRLDKNVVMLEYVGENHGLRDPANRKDYTVRMREFFDHYLRDIGMPGWLQDGVPYLEREAHLKARAQAIADQVEAARKAAEAAKKAADEAKKAGGQAGTESRQR